MVVLQSRCKLFKWVHQAVLSQRDVIRFEEPIPQAEPERAINSLQLGKVPELVAKFFRAFKQKLIPAVIPGKTRIKLPHYSHTEKGKAINYWGFLWFISFLKMGIKISAKRLMTRQRLLFSMVSISDLLVTSCLIAVSRWAVIAIDLCSLNSIIEPRTNPEVLQCKVSIRLS